MAEDEVAEDVDAIEDVVSDAQDDEVEENNASRKYTPTDKGNKEHRIEVTKSTEDDVVEDVDVKDDVQDEDVKDDEVVDVDVVEDDLVEAVDVVELVVEDV